MALLFADGFEQYSDSSDMLMYNSASSMPGRWVASISNTTTSPVRTTQPSGSSQSLWLNSPAWFATASLPTTATLITGFCLYATNCSNTQPVLAFTTQDIPAPTLGLSLYTLTDGSLQVRNNSTSAIYLTTATGLITNSIWSYIEIKAVFGAAGSLKLNVDDTTVGTVSGVDTRGGITGSEYTRVTVAGGTNPRYVDDLYICDSTGTVNNNLLGPVNVYTLFPTAAASATNLTPVGVATNWDAVNEQDFDAATYVKTTAPAIADYYNVADLTVTPNNIHGVSVNNVSTKMDNGARKSKNKIKVGASEVVGTSNVAQYNNYQRSCDLYEAKPGGGAWDLASINSMEIGIESE